MKRKQQEYQLGNELRGWFFRKAHTPREAWARLCRTFNASYPSRGGRSVVLKVLQTIPEGDAHKKSWGDAGIKLPVPIFIGSSKRDKCPL